MPCSTDLVKAHTSQLSSIEAGDIVVGRVIKSNSLGACVWLEQHSVAGPFKVLEMPDDGRGPLLSAMDVDLDVLMLRMEQVKEVADQELLTFPMTVVAANGGGLTCLLLGVMGRAFMPWSLLNIRRWGAVSAGWDEW
ncbi:30s ribosomal protein s1, partial [Haematococcus lacustris]